MALPRMPYIEFATEHFLNPRYDLAVSDVAQPDLSPYFSRPEFSELCKERPYTLMKKVISKLAELYGVTKNSVELTMGLSGAFPILAQVMKELGFHEVIAECPGYEPFWLTPESYGLKILNLRRLQNSNGGFKFDLKELDEVSKSGKKWLWITNPHNPSGTFYTKQELQEIASILEKNRCFLFVDEIYHDYYSPLGKESCFSFGKNVIIANSPTKIYGMGALKLGWIVGPQNIIEKCTISRLHQFMLIPGPSSVLFLLFLSEIEKIRQYQVNRIEHNNNLLRAELKNIKNFSSLFPTTGPIGLVKLQDGVDDLKLSIKAAQKGLILSPGHFFKIPNHLRMSCAGELEKMKVALKILNEFIA